MASTLQHHYRLSLTERAGGWVMAVCLHVMLFCTLIIVKPNAAVETPAPQPIQITFTQEPPAAQVSAVTPFEPAAPLPGSPDGDPAAADQSDGPVAQGKDTVTQPGVTQVKPSESDGKDDEKSDGGKVEDAVARFLAKDDLPREVAKADPVKPEAPAKPDAPRSSNPDSVPATTDDPNAPPAADSSEYRELVATMRARSQEMERQNQLARLEGSKEVAGRLMSTHATKQADKTLFSADPLHTGVIRTVETTDVPNNIADEVLKRWGFRVKLMNLSGGVRGGGSGYLSGIQTSAGRFVNATGQPGLYRVLFLGDDTVRRLVDLENAEMQKKGYDPEKVHITQVVFGIVPKGKEYDLAVTKMMVEPNKAATPAPVSTEPIVKRVD
ncbi:hypothetical protein LLG95_15150 [bacterium]|nr:hypothetical protein [bacterium]